MSKVIKTKSGVEVKYREFVTGADKEAFDEEIASNTDITVTVGADSRQSQQIKVDARAQIKLNKIMVERFIEEVAGVAVSGEEARLKLLELPADDYQQVIDALAKLTNSIGLDAAQKKISESSTPV